MGSGISYADPAVGAVFASLVVPVDDLARITHDAQTDAEGFRGRLKTYLWARFPGLLTHEWAHVLQVAQYPLLHLRAARQARLIGVKTLATGWQEVPAELPIRWSMNRRWQESSLIETAPVRMTIETDGIASKMLQPDAVARGSLRELDLVEEDATILQYRVEIGSRGTGPGYRRWLVERPRYCAMFYFLADLMNDDDALNLIPVMTRVAFTTTRPLESLAAMLTDIIRDGSDTYTTEFPDEEWDLRVEDFFNSRLLERFGEADEKSSDFRFPALDDHQGVIPSGRFTEMVKEAPFLAASKLAEWSAVDGRNLLADVLRAPWRYFERGAHSWPDELRLFEPPVSVYLLTGENSSYMRTFVVTSEAMRSTPFTLPDANLASLHWNQVAFEFLRAKQLLDVSMGIRGPLGVCPHIECRFNGKGLCEGWLPLPETAKECDFPEWLAKNASRTVSPDGATLIETGRNPHV